MRKGVVISTLNTASYSYSFFKYLYEVLIKYRVHKICISVWSLRLQRHPWLHFNQSKAFIRDLMEHIHMRHWQAHIKHVYTWRELGSHSFSLSFSLCHKHTHSGDWNPIITEQQSPLTTGWPRTDHVMVRSLGPSTEKHFPRVSFTVSLLVIEVVKGLLSWSIDCT